MNAPFVSPRLERRPMLTEAQARHRRMMKRAKAHFCRTYNFPAAPFRASGRACLASSIAIAKEQLAAEDKAAAMPKAERLQRISDLEELRIEYRDSCGRCGAEYQLKNINYELSLLRGVDR